MAVSAFSYIAFEKVWDSRIEKGWLFVQRYNFLILIHIWYSYLRHIFNYYWTCLVTLEYLTVVSVIAVSNIFCVPFWKPDECRERNLLRNLIRFFSDPPPLSPPFVSFSPLTRLFQVHIHSIPLPPQNNPSINVSLLPCFIPCINVLKKIITTTFQKKHYEHSAFLFSK